MQKKELPPSEALYPLPVVLVSCPDKKLHKTNAITIAWCGVVCSNPPLVSVSIRPSRYSHKLITEANDFAVNIPSSDMIKESDFCGIRSGREWDKLTLCHLTTSPGKKISSPIINECPVNIECSLKQVIRLGSHDMFIGQVVCVRASQDLIGKNGNIDYSKTNPFVYNQGEYWDLGKRIGSYGFSGK